MVLKNRAGHRDPYGVMNQLRTAIDALKQGKPSDGNFRQKVTDIENSLFNPELPREAYWSSKLNRINSSLRNFITSETANLTPEMKQHVVTLLNACEIWVGVNLNELKAQLQRPPQDAGMESRGLGMR